MIPILTSLGIVLFPIAFVCGVMWERTRNAKQLASVAAKAIEDHEAHASIHPIPYRPDQRRRALADRITQELRWRGVL